MAKPLFPPDFLERLEYLALVSRRVFRGSLLAQRRTRAFGSGVEFTDHRQYLPGDDFRHLDWNLFARSGELLLRRFQEEQDLHVHFLLDCSPSMAFGEPAKFDLARRLTAALAYVALADLDRVAVAAFADDVLADFALTRGKARILALMDWLAALPVGGADTSLSASVARFLGRGPKPGLAVVVSDLFDPAGFEEPLDRLRHHRHEPHVVRLFDPMEADPRLLGELELEDVETGDVRRVVVTERVAKEYVRRFRAFGERVAAYSSAHGLGGVAASTELDYEAVVMRMMESAGVGR